VFWGKRAPPCFPGNESRFATCAPPRWGFFARSLRLKIPRCRGECHRPPILFANAPIRLQELSRRDRRTRVHPGSGSKSLCSRYRSDHRGKRHLLPEMSRADPFCSSSTGEAPLQNGGKPFAFVPDLMKPGDAVSGCRFKAFVPFLRSLWLVPAFVPRGEAIELRKPDPKSSSSGSKNRYPEEQALGSAI